MATRDAAEYERRRQQIMDGALAAFATHGFAETTNRQIARAAGIGSPGLIYHYFDSKADLLRQSIAARSPALQELIRDESLRDRPLREGLRIIGLAVTDSLSDPVNLSLFRVVVGEAMRDPTAATAWHPAGALPGIAALIRYLEAQMALGHLRLLNPMAAAFCFLGPLVLHLMASDVFMHPGARSISHQQLVEGMVDVFLRGLEAP